LARRAHEVSQAAGDLKVAATSSLQCPQAVGYTRNLAPVIGLVSKLQATIDARIAFETSLANIKAHCERNP